MPPAGTPYVRGWELVALNRAGFHAAFFDGLEKTFGAMLDAGATTYWEGFDAAETGNARYAFYGRPWGKSLCHAWSAWPAFLFVSEAMGVRPTADGWAAYEAKTVPGRRQLKDRPKEAKELGHFEMDTVISRRGSRGGLLVMLDRCSRRYVIEHVNHISQDEVIMDIKRRKTLRTV